jgi:histidinol phosphatase-like PHP family hydrolase
MQATRPPLSLDLLCDNHIHTRFCGHATGEMEEYVLSAIAKGLRKIVFLEHMEEGIVSQPVTWLSEETFDRYLYQARSGKLPGTMLCHLDGALRFVPETSLTDAHLRMIDRLLQTVRDKGMALEINTFGVTLRHQPFPTEQIVSLALAYRIPLVLGSDAHSPADVGRHFSDIGLFIH